ncbi:MAG: flagellin [Rhodospirillaceae bacterium]|nr:flagellin [Rhodospirillaceae bacterium]|tara:strand:+ start:259 stop:1083 length:825 start_codon:yes stop_codon:yes gene_type:complete
MADVTLTKAVRQNLLTLQRSSGLIDRTQDRLASGLRVSSPVDDAGAFFTARALSNRADDFSKLRGDIDVSISTVNAALDGIDAITELVEQARGLANNAKATGSLTERSTLAKQFNDILTQIDNLTKDASFNGTNLLKATPDNLVVTFNETGTNTLTVTGLDSTTAATGLNVANAANNFGAAANINVALTAIGNALTELRTNASTLGSNSTVLQTRLNFSDSLINTLQDGSGKLTLADLNEESANLLALQTRQQLGINSLALASQSERGILALFG